MKWVPERVGEIGAWVGNSMAEVQDDRGARSAPRPDECVRVGCYRRRRGFRRL